MKSKWRSSNWKMGEAGRRDELERRAEVPLTPEHMFAADIDAPDVTALRQVAQPSNHESRPAAEIENAFVPIKWTARGQ